MKFDLLECKINAALDELIQNECILLKNKVHERAICHKLGKYIEDCFKEYDVDYEYDRNTESLDKVKYIYEIEYEYGQIITNAKQIIPNIIVHKREVNSENLLLIEVKKSNSKKSKKDLDEIKLKSATSKVLSNISYQYGLFINLGVESNTGYYELVWYKDSKEIKRVSIEKEDLYT